MPKVKALFSILSAVILLSFAAHAEEKFDVFVSILPQQYFVQKIGKDRVTIHVMVMPGADPHSYEPKPRQMTLISKASLYFAIGVPFENTWLSKLMAINPTLRVVQTDVGIKKLSMLEEHPNEHGQADSHGDGGLDPHIWLSPALVKIQAKYILEALQQVKAADKVYFKTNYDLFMKEIDDLDIELKRTFAGRQGLKFMVFHPSWGYFADAYGLQQVSVEVEGKNPKPSQLVMLIQKAKQDGIRTIFAQPQFSSKAARLLAGEINGNVILIDPLAFNWSENLRQVAQQLAQTAQ